MSNFFSFSHYYFVGLKGVAMTSLASCLISWGKKVSGTDIEEDFPTKENLERLKLTCDFGFQHQLDNDIDCVIYTGAHGGSLNPIVLQAKNNNIACFSQAEALSFLFNQKKGLAVCGVGGKSTISAMLAFILKKMGVDLSYSVGVGDILGLLKTGDFTKESKFFIAEADEYVDDPSVFAQTKIIVPRFSYLKPFLIICSNLRYDHPDVYADFSQTKEIFLKFFKKISSNGYFIYSSDDQNLVQLIEQWGKTTSNLPKIISYGCNARADWQLVDFKVKNSCSVSKIKFKNKIYNLQLTIPGRYNATNSLAALAAIECLDLNFNIIKSFQILKQFQSTKRRLEFLGEIHGCLYYDDYAHHPNEIVNVIQAIKQWHPKRKITVAFQSHTFSRTKKLFFDFVAAFALADQVVMTDIFASMREKFDKEISSTLLCREIEKKFSHIKAQNLKTTKNLALFCYKNLRENDLLLCVGAGDIYHFFPQLKLL